MDQQKSVVNSSVSTFNPELEPLLRENPRRFVIFPIQYPDIWQMYKKVSVMKKNEIRAPFFPPIFFLKLLSDVEFFLGGSFVLDCGGGGSIQGSNRLGQIEFRREAFHFPRFGFLRRFRWYCERELGRTFQSGSADNRSSLFLWVPDRYGERSLGNVQYFD